MIVNLPYFRELKAKHAKEILMILLERDEPFSILAHLPAIEFNPPLPEHITKQFTEIIVFAIANYTLQSAHILDENFIFEAGFGEENIGSVVTVPIENIIQITQDEVPLFINAAATLPKEEKPKNPFAMNPRNKKFIKE
ncbi:hypothetical protein [Nautilia lithotrophica]